MKKIRIIMSVLASAAGMILVLGGNLYVGGIILQIGMVGSAYWVIENSRDFRPWLQTLLLMSILLALSSFSWTIGLIQGISIHLKLQYIEDRWSPIDDTI